MNLAMIIMATLVVLTLYKQNCFRNHVKQCRNRRVNEHEFVTIALTISGLWEPMVVIAVIFKLPVTHGKNQIAHRTLLAQIYLSLFKMVVANAIVLTVLRIFGFLIFDQNGFTVVFQFIVLG